MLAPYVKILNLKYFKYLWVSQILSQITINILNFILLIRLFEKTQSSIATSFLWVAYALPAIFFGPIAAASTDMFNKKRILIITNFLQGATIFLYAFLHETSLFLLYFVVLTYSFLNQFYVPSEAATLPFLLTKKNLAIGNSLFFITQQASLLLGFGISGFLLKILGFQISLLLCSVMLLIAFAACFFLPEITAKEILPNGIFEAIEKFFKSISQGYTYIRNERTVLAPLVLLLVIQISLAIVTVSIPSIAQEILKIPLDKAGIYIVVPASLGALAGALSIAKFLKEGTRKIVLIKNSLIILVVALLTIIFLVSLLNYDLRVVIGAFCLSLIGFSFMGIFIPSQTFLQESTSSEFRGRVFGNFWFIVTIASIFPVLISGTITELLGIKIFLFLMGITYIGIYYIMAKEEVLYSKNDVE